VIGIPDTCSPHYIGYLRFFFVISNVNICFVSGNLLLEIAIIGSEGVRCCLTICQLYHGEQLSESDI
jgi:hypothetical protein